MCAFSLIGSIVQYSIVRTCPTTYSTLLSRSTVRTSQALRHQTNLKPNFFLLPFPLRCFHGRGIRLKWSRGSYGKREKGNDKTKQRKGQSDNEFPSEQQLWLLLRLPSFPRLRGCKGQKRKEGRKKGTTDKTTVGGGGRKEKGAEANPTAPYPVG